MTRRTISTEKAPAAIGPYAQGVAAGGLLFTAMQIALDPTTGELVGETAPEQARQCLANLGAIAEAAGASLADVVQARVYLTDLGTFAAVNEVYAEYFPRALPARAVVGVAALPKDARIAIEAVVDVSEASAE